MGSKEGKSWRVHWAVVMNGFWRGLKWMPFCLFLGGAGVEVVGVRGVFAVAVAVAVAAAAGGSMVAVVAMVRTRHGWCWRTLCERRKPLNSCLAGAVVRGGAMLLRDVRGVGVVQSLNY